jgi:3D (Asp-Asp-Asp) domain-containing protein
MVSILTTFSFALQPRASAGREGGQTYEHNWSEGAQTKVRLKSLGTFKPTFYWITLEENYDGPKTKEVLDINGNVLVKVSEKYFKSLQLEGTGRLSDGRVLNYHERVVLPDGKKEIRYRFCGPDAPYGYGYGDFKLIPFRSIAVDITVVPLGTKVYIPEAKGTKLPDGTVHDGIFYAIDIGDAIQNKRIDIFTSFGDQSKVFSQNGLSNMKATEVFLIEEPTSP